MVEADVSVTPVGSLIKLTIWYKLFKDVTLFVHASGGDLPRSQFKSPIIIISLYSISHLKRNSSYSFIIFNSEFGGRYQALNKNGLLCGRSISIQISTIPVLYNICIACFLLLVFYVSGLLQTFLFTTRRFSVNLSLGFKNEFYPLQRGFRSFVNSAWISRGLRVDTNKC